MIVREGDRITPDQLKRLGMKTAPALYGARPPAFYSAALFSSTLFIPLPAGIFGNINRKIVICSFWRQSLSPKSWP